MEMKLYIITAKQDVGWDEYAGFVLYARSPKDARKLAATETEDREKNTWLNPRLSTLKELSSTSKNEGVVMYDFKAG